jgi:hypothetical protein
MDALTQPARESNRSIFLFRIGIGLLLISIALTLLMTQMQEGPPARDFLFAACLFVVTPLASIASVLSFSAVRRRPLLSVCLLPVAYVFGFMLHISAVFAEAAALGPYTDWYNHTKKSRAEAARLVGSSESGSFLSWGMRTTSGGTGTG